MPKAVSDASGTVYAVVGGASLVWVVMTAIVSATRMEIGVANSAQDKQPRYVNENNGHAAPVRTERSSSGPEWDQSRQFRRISRTVLTLRNPCAFPCQKLQENFGTVRAAHRMTLGPGPPRIAPGLRPVSFGRDPRHRLATPLRTRVTQWPKPGFLLGLQIERWLREK